MNNTFNQTILKALKGNKKAIQEITQNGFTVRYQNDSVQGYPTIYHNGVELVISKGFDDRTHLYVNSRSVTGFKSLPKVDYMNLIRMTNERPDNNHVDPLYRAYMKRDDLIRRKRKIKRIQEEKAKLQEQIKELDKELYYLQD